MYVAHDKERQYSFLLSFLTLIVLLTLVHFNSKILNGIDALLQGFVVNVMPNISFFNRTLSFFSYPMVCVLYALLIWFFLWGFKHKIPATWVLSTFISGELILIIMRDLNRREYISGSFFSILLVGYCMITMVVPLIRSKQNQNIAKIVLILIMILVGIAHVQLGHVSVVGIAISWLPVNAWLQIARGQYLKRFADLQKFPIFRHSDYN